MILDTHVLLWYLLNDSKLSQNIIDMISLTKNAGGRGVIISSITLWEISMLMSKNRLDIQESTESFLEAIANAKGLSIVDISPKIAALSNSLPGNFHGDPFDRIITATAICHKASLVTKDRQILEWSLEQNVKTIYA